MSPGIQPDEAYQMLMCKYLRFTKDNVKSLTAIARGGGYDVTLHCHLTDEDLENLENSIFD